MERGDDEGNLTRRTDGKKEDDVEDNGAESN